MSDTLMTSAEIAVGIAGFMAVAVALGRLNPDSERGGYRFATVASVPFLAIFYALLPVVLVHLVIPEDRVLRVSSAVMSLCSAAWMYVAISRARVLAFDMSTFAERVSATAGTANVIAQILNATVFPEPTRFGVYFAGIVWYLLYAVFTLFRAVMEQDE